MGRKIAAVILGMLVGGGVVFGMETLGHTLFPPPPGLKADDAEALKAYIATLPLAVMLMVLIAHALGSFAGAAVASLVSGRASLRPALIVGALLMLGGIANVVTLPHPRWFAIADLALYLPAAYLSARLLLRPQHVPQL